MAENHSEYAVLARLIDSRDAAIEAAASASGNHHPSVHRARHGVPQNDAEHEEWRPLAARR